MNTPHITIILPTYRPGPYLQECLDSLQAQTLDHQMFEVIIILNGCDEPYHTTLRQMLRESGKNLRTTLIHTPEPGVSNARNLGIEKAAGRWIAFLDDDDRLSPDYLHEMYRIASTGVVPLSNLQPFTDGPGRPAPDYVARTYARHSRHPHITILQVRSYFSIPCCKLLPRHTIGHRRFDTRFHNGEDSLFMFLISDRIGPLAFTPPHTLHYRRLRDGSASRRKRPLKETLTLNLKLIQAYTAIYIRHPRRYHFPLYGTRVLAEIADASNHIRQHFFSNR